MLEAKSVTKAVIPSSLIPNPSPANFHSSRLAIHVSQDASSSWLYVASGSQVFKLRVPIEDSFVSKGKESLLIPKHTQVSASSVVNRCPHRSEIQTVVLAETENNGYLMLGSVDYYGGVIVSKLDVHGNDVDRLTYTVSPRDRGVGESSWAGLCFSPTQCSMMVSIVHCSKYEITELNFSSFHSDYIYVQGVDYEAFCGNWKAHDKIFSFRGDSNWLGLSKCHDRDVFGGWCDSGSVFVVDVVKAN